MNQHPKFVEMTDSYPSRCPICGRSGEPPIPNQTTQKPVLAEPEALITLRELAEVLNVPLFAVRRAANKGLFRTYSIGNGRKRARLSEVIAAIQAEDGAVK